MPAPEPLSALLLPRAANNRHGLVFEPQTATVSKSDIAGIFHVGVPYSASNAWKSASGGVAKDLELATLAAVGEGVERYVAAISPVQLKHKLEIIPKMRVDADGFTLFSEEQRSRQTFPFTNLYADTCMFTEVFRLDSNEPAWVPQPLVTLRDDFQTGIPTSSGLAAAPTAELALLRGLQEIIERDSLMATWLHSLPARAVRLPKRFNRQIVDLGGDAQLYDLTPAYSPFPVMAVAGGIPQRGTWRFSLGIACRETFAQAAEKAFLEWCQGVYFAGVYPKFVDTTRVVGDVSSFDDHAIYYTSHPDEWQKLPFTRRREHEHRPIQIGRTMTPREALRLAVNRLSLRGIRLFYRDLTTIDALQAGIRVVRVLSPELIPINAHHEWPFLGGTSQEVRFRYKWAPKHTEFPNSFPHPLG